MNWLFGRTVIYHAFLPRFWRIICLACTYFSRRFGCNLWLSIYVSMTSAIQGFLSDINICQYNVALIPNYFIYCYCSTCVMDPVSITTTVQQTHRSETINRKVSFYINPAGHRTPDLKDGDIMKQVCKLRDHSGRDVII